MLSSIARRFALVAILMTAFTLAGCGDKEPEQRKAFIDILQTRIVGAPQRSVAPALSDKDKEALGPYAAQYQLLRDFASTEGGQEGLAKLVAVQGKIKNAQDLQDNWKSLAIVRTEITGFLDRQKEQLKATEATRATFKQPDDLKAVYDQAYKQVVTDQAALMQKISPTLFNALQAMENLGQFLDENRSKLKISGTVIESTDTALEARLQNLMQVYQTAAQQMLTAIQPLMQKRRR